MYHGCLNTSEYLIQKSIALYLHSSPVIDNILSGIFLLSLPAHSGFWSVVLLKLFSFGNDLLTLLIKHHKLHDQIHFSMEFMAIRQDTERVTKKM